MFDSHKFAMNQVIKVGENAVFDCLFVSDLEVVIVWTKAVTEYNRTVFTNIPVFYYQF